MRITVLPDFRLLDYRLTSPTTYYVIVHFLSFKTNVDFLSFMTIFVLTVTMVKLTFCTLSFTMVFTDIMKAITHQRSSIPSYFMKNERININNENKYDYSAM